MVEERQADLHSYRATEGYHVEVLDQRTINLCAHWHSGQLH